ncbi:hypothetical protein RD792_002354 [Penstemon davidsonii]|uniref:Fibronectin type III-like domain-containing protein n=1 Tax=Penstemon davidsonii TaxID=160366 RepID=A0ABR0DQV5_9LAMI|nr:hypothetical protein RD792_002354 [Penstemon davidsonii]
MYIENFRRNFCPSEIPVGKSCFSCSANFTYNLVSSTKSLHVKLNKFQHCRDLNYIEGSYKPPCPSILIDDLKCDDHTVKVEVEVQNVGNMDGSDVVMVYWTAPSGISEAPIKQLVAFKRIFVAAGGSKKVGFELNACKNLGIDDFRGYNLLPSGGGNMVIGDDLVSIPVQILFER